jgi:hypothetical protein
MNWILHKIPGAKETQHLWSAHSPFFHAATLLLAHRIQDRVFANAKCPPKNQPVQRQRYLLQAAWKRQNDPEDTTHRWKVDVDKEAIENLEKGMFEHSEETAQSGNWQWGLDAGDHQGKWCPYNELPSDWSTRRGQDNDEECKVMRLPQPWCILIVRSEGQNISQMKRIMIFHVPRHLKRDLVPHMCKELPKRGRQHERDGSRVKG